LSGDEGEKGGIEHMAKYGKPVKDMRLRPGMTVGELVAQMDGACGFTSKAIADGVDVLEDMIKDKKCVRFLSFPACINATGLRGVIRDLIKNKFFDAVITTCGTLDHDLARAWKDYYHGDFELDDRKLHKKGVNRLGNVLVPNDSYGIVLEKRLRPILQSMYDEGKKSPSTLTTTIR
jgi:deoxyhypusine synthase